jgi:Prolyl oligopeptidase family
MALRWGILLFLLAVGVGRAQGPADSFPDNVKRVPPPGIMVPDADRAELQAGVTELGKEIDATREALQGKPALLELLPDVQIFHNAVRYALTYNEFYRPNEIDTAKAFLQQGMERAKLLRDGKAPWTTDTGLIVRGYVSKIDGSVQPYGLLVPASYLPNGPQYHRLDAWFHGRGENLSEISFIRGCQRSPGPFSPPHAFVLQLYGRYCNANRFAGEVDLFEALENVQKHYRVDENRIAVRGFSMGGASCWDFGTHYAGKWAAIAPGAGFSETADFLKVFQRDPIKPTWFEQKLWHMYDAVDYAINLFNCPTVAYSGELDGQKQAADFMAKALAAEGIEMMHIIGPQTRHAYERQAKEELDRRMDAIMARGRNPMPHHVRFTTWLLRYNEMFWVKVQGMEQEWERARVDADIVDPSSVQVKTQNVDALTLQMAPGMCPLDDTRRPAVTIDQQKLEAAPVMSDRSWTANFRKSNGKWTVVASLDDDVLRKRPGLQGPIDDAFMDSFLMVSPTGSPLNEKVGAWATAEEKHAIFHWRLQFRGEARVKDDAAVTDEDIAAHNLVLWGDPSSNRVLAKIADKLPIRWDAQGVHVGAQNYAADQHVPVLVYPNPLNPKRYVVLNSGFTFREYDYLNNARQQPKLPDWAVVDISTPPSSRFPGKIVAANFFGEKWELKAENPAPK